jgi:hypothetical protein
MEITPQNIITPTIGGINTKDYPDFADAYLEDAYVKEDGLIRPLTEEECAEFTETYSEWIHELIFDEQLWL